MPPGRTVFAQLMDHVSRFEFQTCVARYDGEYKTSRFSCWDQYLSLAFAQLTYRESLRDIEACLRAVQPKLYHIGIPRAWRVPYPAACADRCWVGGLLGGLDVPHTPTIERVCLGRDFLTSRSHISAPGGSAQFVGSGGAAVNCWRTAAVDRAR